MNENLFNVKLSLIPPHNTRYDYDRAYAPTSTLHTRQKIIILGSRLIVCCKLALTVARQM